MTILLDSHAFVWWLLDDKRLSPSAFSAIEQDPEVYVSAVTAWEIAGKVRTGKWREAEILSEKFFDTISQYQLRPLPISLEHAHLAGSLPSIHRDPFDRMLAAQAMVEEMPLVTADPAFKNFEVQVVW
jgi:PIN domain nuclease of toxin-antitoxin system